MGGHFVKREDVLGKCVLENKATSVHVKSTKHGLQGPPLPPVYASSTGKHRVSGVQDAGQPQSKLSLPQLLNH